MARENRHAAEIKDVLFLMGGVLMLTGLMTLMNVCGAALGDPILRNPLNISSNSTSDTIMQDAATGSSITFAVFSVLLALFYKFYKKYTDSAERFMQSTSNFFSLNLAMAYICTFCTAFYNSRDPMDAGKRSAIAGVGTDIWTIAFFLAFGAWKAGDCCRSSLANSPNTAITNANMPDAEPTAQTRVEIPAELPGSSNTASTAVAPVGTELRRPAIDQRGTSSNTGCSDPFLTTVFERSPQNKHRHSLTSDNAYRGARAQHERGMVVPDEAVRSRSSLY